MTTELTSTQTPKLVTLTCSGGISLGAYMGGVFYELVKEAVKDNPKITIDIITGASAGAMSGAIAAYYLLGECKKQLLSGRVEDDLFYQAWVKKADIKYIEQLQPEEIRDSKNLSVLSGKAIEQIATLVDKTPESKAETKPLALLMTVTNLQGLLKNRKGRKVITSAETRRFLFEPGIEPNIVNEMWKKVVLSARISGAFPVAFPPLADISSIDSYNFKDLSDDYFEPNTNPKVFKKDLGSIYVDETHLKFLYTDGGVLDNLPICQGIDFETELLALRKKDKLEIGATKSKLEAKQFSLILEKSQPQDLSKRLYVYVVPAPIKNLKGSKRLTKENFSMIEVGLSGLKLPKAEQDSIQVNEIIRRNQQFIFKQQLLEELKNCNGNTEQVKAILEEAIPYRNIELSEISPDIIKLAPIFLQLPPDIQSYLKNSNAEDLLASDFLGAFGGFFNETYREHDFLLGRLCGIAWLQLNCPGTNVSSDEVEKLVNEIRQKFLKYDPQPSNLKLSQKVRIGRIAIRALRIVVIEAEIKGSIWKILFEPLRILTIIILRILEGLVTVTMKVLEIFGV